MRKVFTISFLSNLYLFAENIEANNQMPWLIPWLITFLLLIGLLFWSFYRAIKSRNAKYGYLIGFVIFLMVVLLLL